MDTEHDKYIRLQKRWKMLYQQVKSFSELEPLDPHDTYYDGMREAYEDVLKLMNSWGDEK